MKSELSRIHQDARIGVFGHFGRNNLGDEATIQAVIQNIRHRLPRATIIGFSMGPDDTARRHQIKAFPIRWTAATSYSNERVAAQEPKTGWKPADNGTRKIRPDGYKQALKKVPLLHGIFKGGKHLAGTMKQLIAEIKFIPASFRSLKDIDFLLIVGSNQFLDNFEGPWGFPYTLWKWSILAKLSGAKLYYMSVGAGPISSRLSYIFIRGALRCADYISLRDEASKRLIEEIYAPVTACVYPDLALGLEVRNQGTESNTEPWSESRLPVVAINPLPMYDSRYWCVEDNHRYTEFVHKLATFCSQLLMEGYSFFFFGTQPGDEVVIDDILALLGKDVVSRIDQLQVRRKNSSVEECMANLSCADIVVACRFHGAVLSFVADKPVLGICYYRKAKDLMLEMGQEDYALDIDSFTPEALWMCLKSLEKNYHKEIETIRDKNKTNRMALKEQYDRLFSSFG